MAIQQRSGRIAWQTIIARVYGPGDSSKSWAHNRLGGNVRFLRFTSNATGSLATHDAHRHTVDGIARDVHQFYKRQEKFRIYHGSTNSTRPRPGNESNLVDTSALTRVLEIDTSRKIALVEPNVPMDRLIEATLEYGLIPPVVMEFPGITAGGGYAGTSGESSSFKHGFFDQTLNRVEMVLGNGEIVTCSKTENSDLFHGAAGALGTLGITTLIELRLQEAKKYVQTIYHPISNVKESIDLINSLTNKGDADYIDGVLFREGNGAVISGHSTNDPDQGLKIQTFSNASDPWFYMHLQDILEQNDGPITETIPLPEYLFRYDRGGFWVGQSAFDYFKLPSNKFTRWFLDDFLHTRMMYSALHASGQSQKYIVQDLALPYNTAEDFIKYCEEVFDIYPLWLCPLKQSPLPTMHPHTRSSKAGAKTLEPMLNIGLWGFSRQKNMDYLALNKDLERKLRELGGMKWLYAQTFYTEEEFWELYDWDWYNSLRIKYHATSLPTVFEKVRPSTEARKSSSQLSLRQSLQSIWPLGGFYGLYKAIQSKTYLQARAATWKQPRG